MIFTLVVLSAPGSSQGANSALNFAQSTIKAGHSIYRLFFYGDGVHNATSLAAPPQDERHLPREWQTFIAEHNLDAVVCIAAAIRRGILDDTESTRYDKTATNLAPEFELAGLGQLIDACTLSDRVITFG